MDDHDQRIKELLKVFLSEFIFLFFPQWADQFEFAQTEWLEQDAFLDPPDGERRQIDLLAKVPTPEPVGDRSDNCLILIHIEVDSATSATRLRNRMLQYYAYLRRAYNLPVLPIGLFLRVGLGGIGRDTYKETLLGETLLQFDYFSIGLPALDSTKYQDEPNLLGLALSSLMRLPAKDRALLLTKGLERIAISSENELRKYLLADCFQHYFPITEFELEEARRLMAERFPSGRTIMNGLELRELKGEQRGEKRGEQRGRQLALRETVVKQLTKKFGPLPTSVATTIEAAPLERLDEILLAVLDATSLAELGLTDG